MTPQEFKANEGMVSWLAGLLGSPEWKTLRETLDQMHPRFDPVHPDPSSTAIAVGRTMGFDGVFLCLAELSRLYKPVELAATFEPDKEL